MATEHKEVTATDIKNYEKISPWQINENNTNENYYDKNGKYLGHLEEKEVLEKRTYSPYYEGYFPGRYNLKFSNGDKFERVLDLATDGVHGTFFYKEPAKGGRSRKQTKRRKTSKKRKARRKSIRRR